MNRLVLSVFLLLGCVAAVQAQTPDVARACESFAQAQAKRAGGDLRSVTIAREEFPVVSRIEERIGGVFVVSEYEGRASFVDAAGARRSGYVCRIGRNGKPVGFAETPLPR